MKRIQHSDWLPGRARLAYLARSGFPALFPARKSSVFGHIIIPLLTKLVIVKMLVRSFLPFY